MKTSVTFLFSLLFGVATAKNLVFLAGPHKSESEEVGKLFFNHATGEETSSGLNGWVWPQIKEDLPGEDHRVFENFFWNSKNATMQDILMSGIEDAWEASQHGIIIGAEGFDHTRGDPHSQGLEVMLAIIDRLGVSSDNVQVVLMYRSPRIGQWLGLYQNHNGPYDEFVCEIEYTEHLANIPMNPLMLAGVYRSQGWKVAIVDSGGTRNKSLDVAHTVACGALPKVDCVDGFVSGLDGQYYVFEDTEDLTSGAVGQTTTEALASAEQLFRDRDCYYKDSLVGDEDITLLHTEAMWTSCKEGTVAQSRYRILAEPDFFYEQLKALHECESTGGQGLVVEDSDDSGNNLVYTIVACALVGFCLVLHLIGRFKRRQTHYVKSPMSAGESAVWMDFADEAFQVGNLQTNSLEDDNLAFTDVDLKTPPATQSPGPKNFGQKVSKTDPALLAAAKEGRSVRGMYRVGLYQSSPAAKAKPVKGDSNFEFKIKKLEQEFV